MSASLMVAKTLPAAGHLRLNFLSVLPSMSWLPWRSTSKLNSARKSAPRMGKATPANRKFQVNCRPQIPPGRSPGISSFFYKFIFYTFVFYTSIFYNFIFYMFIFYMFIFYSLFFYTFIFYTLIFYTVHFLYGSFFIIQNL